MSSNGGAKAGPQPATSSSSSSSTSSSSSSSAAEVAGATVASADVNVRVGGSAKRKVACVKPDSKLASIQKSIEKSLPNMMYGYGDSDTPLKSTTAVLGNLAIDFVGEMTKQMVAVIADRGDRKLSYENLLFLVREDSYQFDRGWELKTQNEELRKAREIALAKDE